MRGVRSRKLGLALGFALILLVITVVPAPAAPVTATVPYLTTAVADGDLDGNPATGSWSDAGSWSIPLENGAAAPYGSATLYAKHDGTYVYFRVDGKIDVSWASSAGDHFWFGMIFTASVTSHHSTWQDGVFFGEDSYTTAPPLLAIDTNGGGKPPTKDATQSDLGRMAASGSAAPYSYTAEWKRKLSTGDANDLTFLADGATSYYFYATSDSNGGGSGGGTINHKVTTNDNVLRFAQVSPGDTTPPTVSLTSPADGATVNGIVSIAATATDDVGVTKVEFYADTTLLGTDTASPYSQSWDTATYAQGAHQVSAKAYDAAANVGNAAISVNVDHTARAVSITSPADGAILTGGVTIAANATDPGGVTQVAFSVDAILLGTDTTAPYSQAWDTTTSPEGARTLTAEASFASGGTMNGTVTVIVDRTPPLAQAGPDRSVPSGTTVVLNGSGSSDANGIAGWTWSFTDGSLQVLHGSAASYRFSNVGDFLVNLSVVDPAGNQGQDLLWVNVTARDTTPPMALGVPVVSSAGPGMIEVTWASSDAADLAGYVVLRAASAEGPYLQLNLEPLPQPLYVDTGLDPGATYFYEVVAVDVSGNPSSPSPYAAGIAGLNPQGAFDVMSLRWVIVPFAAAVTLAFLALLAWREDRRRHVPPPPPTQLPPPPEVGP